MYVYTVLKTSGHVSRQTLIVLLREAFNMYQRGDRRVSLKDEGFEGVLTTDYATAVLGNFGGPVFTAEVQQECGKGRASFILDSDSLAFAAQLGINDAQDAPAYFMEDLFSRIDDWETLPLNTLN